MPDDFLAAIGVSDPDPAPTAAPAAAAPTSAPRTYDPVDAAIRTIRFEAPPNASKEERQAMASVIVNRAKASGKTFDQVVQEGDGSQFNTWKPGSKARQNVEALAADDPTYKATAADVADILAGKSNPYPTLTHFYAPGGMKDGAKPDWDDGTGQQIGASKFFAKGGEGGSDPFLAAMGVDPTKIAKEDAKAALTATTWRLPLSKLSPAQRKVYEALNMGEAYDPDAPLGSIKNPLFEGPENPATDAAPGTYIVPVAGKIVRTPGGEEKSSILKGVGQGVADLALTGFNMLPGKEDSDWRNMLAAGQMAYDADYKGDTASGIGRFIGQVGASAPLIATGEGALAPALRMFGPAGEFIAGNAGRGVSGLKGLLMRGSSMAAKGAAEGAAGAGLVSSASDAPLTEQLKAGAVGGALAGPVLPAVAGAGRWAGRTARDLVEPLTEGGRAKIADRIVGKFAGDQPMAPDATEIIPGSKPTLATATGNPGVATLERTVRLSQPGPFAERDAQNAAARADFLDDARGNDASVADLVRVRENVVREARRQAFDGAGPVESQGVVQALDDALAAPEAQMESVARPLQALRDKLVQPAAETTPAQIADFNRAVGRTFGADAPALTPEVMSQARQRLGAEFERIAANTEVKWDDALRNDIGQIIHDTAQVIPESRLPPLFKSLMDVASTANDGKTISGMSYQALTKRGGVLDKLQQSSDADVRNAAGAIRDRLDDALEHSMSTKVVDAEGRPMEVFHGSPGKIEGGLDPNRVGEREPGFYGDGFYFTPSKELAESYAGEGGSVTSTQLNIKNPFVVDQTTMESQRATEARVRDLLNLPTDAQVMGAAGLKPDIQKRFTKALQEKGYDGVFVMSTDGDGPVIHEIMAVSPAQMGKGDPAVNELRNVRLRYKNLKTVEKALASAGVDKQVSPDAVLRAVKGNFKDYAYSGGAGLGDVAETAVREQSARPPRVVTDARQIFGMRSSLESQIAKLRKSGTDADTGAADRLQSVVDAMDGSIDRAAPGYAAFMDVAQRHAEPIEAQRYLQSLKLKDSKGNVTLGMVDRALDGIRNARAKPGAHPAKSISGATIGQLEALQADLLRQESLMAGAPRGSATAQHFATGNIAANMNVPLALGASMLTGNPLVGAAMGAGKLFYKMKDEEIQQALVSRLLNAEAPRVVGKSPPSAAMRSLKFMGSPIVPTFAGVLANRLTGAQ